MAKGEGKKGENYITSFFGVKKKFGLNLLQYSLMAAIHSLSNENPDKTKNGWCYASKTYLAELFDISRRNVFNVLNNLIGRGLLEKNTRGYVKPTHKWLEAIKEAQNGVKIGRFTPDGAKISPPSSQTGAKISPPGCKNCTPTGAKISPPSYNDIDNERDISLRRRKKSSSPSQKPKIKGVVRQEDVDSVIALFYKEAEGGRLKQLKQEEAKDQKIARKALERGRTPGDIKKAVMWGIRERGFNQFDMLDKVVNWYMSNKQRKKNEREEEMEELGPGGREILED